MFSIELRQQNQFLNFHEGMPLVTEISAITVIQFRCWWGSEEAGKFENVTVITKEINRYFSEKVLAKFCVPVQAHNV